MSLPQVPVVEVLEVGVWDADALTNDQCLGVVEVDIAEDVAKAPVRTHPLACMPHACLCALLGI